MDRHILQVHVGALSPQYEALSIEVSKQTTCSEIVACIVERLSLSAPSDFELAEVVGNSEGQDCKERRLSPHESPFGLQLLWPHSMSVDREINQNEYRFCLREKSLSDSIWAEPSVLDSQLIKDYFYKFLYQPKDKEYPDLCQLTNLNETTLLENLKARFSRGHIYTYVGSILISVNPFKYYPIYNPKYVKLYQNHRLGDLPPHIFAIADAGYHCMLKQRKNQCIVISGESGSGKTEATLFLLHHLTMLSQKGAHGSGVEQTILSSGPVLEAFGNAKTAHNNNSSRFGKFIQVTYRENGFVQGACVQKYLLEKSRICSQAYNERCYHVFYYLLAGASNQERQALHLLRPSDYRYLNQSECYTIEGCDEQYEFVRLKQSMEMVGFTADKQNRLFAILSAVLLLGNIDFSPKKSTYHHDESVVVRNWEVAGTIALLLGVSQDTLVSALTSKKAKVKGEILVINYRLNEALAARSALAKCLYGALFDWIVLQVNYSLISIKDGGLEHNGNSIGVLDIFGFEDFGNQNRFEQFCINYANEHLQHYFNQHVFEYEQEEYWRENISWKNIAFQDNVDCLALIEGKPIGLLCILDDQCNFPGATNETFLQKINSVQKTNNYYEIPQKRESAFIIRHYAGKVKYQVEDMREKNLDLMRPELISVLKNSCYSIVRELAGADPVAIFRWSILRAFFRGVNAFKSALHKSKRKVSGEHRRYSRQKVSVDNSRILAAIENTQNRLRKTRHSRSKYRGHSSRHQKNLTTVKALAEKTQTLTFQGRIHPSRKLPHTVTGQFQLSLQALMTALNQSNPYFIRCIKSNANKEPNVFDNDLVQRQLRYTGMLDTVKIRQAGFNVRMTYEEFIHHYRILLPKGLLSSQSDVKDFLALLQLDRQDYQTGINKIFMRESQKQKLDSQLHHTILSRIILIQRWYRSHQERTRFLNFRNAVIRIQARARGMITRAYYHSMMEDHVKEANERRRTASLASEDYSEIEPPYVKTGRSISINQQASNYEPTSSDRKRTSLPIVSRDQSRTQWYDIADRIPTTEQQPRKLADSDGTSVPSPKVEEVPFPEIIQQVAPPPRRRSALQRFAPLERTPSDPAGDFVQQDLSLSPKGYLRSDSGRRYSEASVERQQLQRTRQHWLESRTSMQNVADFPQQSVVRELESGQRTPIKTKSFRHRQYQKMPSFEQDQNETENRHNDRQDAQAEEEARQMAIKFPKFKRGFKNLLSKRDGSISESEDNSCESSAPQTPTSVDDAVCPFPSATNPQNLLIKNAQSFDENVGAASQRRESRTKECLQLAAKSAHSKSLDYSMLKVDGDIPANEGSIDDDIKRYLATTHHNLKQSQLRKGENCSACDRPFTKFFINHGYKCIACKRLFHPLCVRSSHSVACYMPNVRKTDRADVEGRWNLTRTSQFIDKSVDVIKDAYELRALEEFITKKIYKLEQSTVDGSRNSSTGSTSSSGPLVTNADEINKDHRNSQVDELFTLSLRRFKCFLVSTYSIALHKDNPDVAIKYKDLIKNFEQVMVAVCLETSADAKFPVNMTVNAFRGFLDEFVKDLHKQEEKNVTKKRRRPRKKKPKKTEEISHMKHKMVNIMVNIPMLCEVCNAFLWLSMKALTCQKCKLTCHQKCLNKVDFRCTHDNRKAIVVSLEKTAGGKGSKKKAAIVLGKIFRIPLENLVLEGEKVPRIVEALLLNIELNGIYVEGLYRKTGALAKAQELRAKIDENPETTALDDYPVHVLATTLKTFLRDLPEPLMTFDAYDPLLHASFLEDKEDMFQATLNVVRTLPRPNYDLLERLIFHLARVAQYECFNRMSCNALAIVFTPCFIRNTREIAVHESLSDISKQTQVVQLLIQRQLKKVYEVMKDIDSVDTASNTAGAKLTSLRSLKRRSVQVQTNEEERKGEPSAIPKLDPRDALAVYNLEEEIQNLQKTRNILTLGLPDLVRASSEEEFICGDMSRACSYEDVSVQGTSNAGSSLKSNPSLTSLCKDNDSGIAAFQCLDRRKLKSAKNLDETEPKDDYSDDTVMV